MERASLTSDIDFAVVLTIIFLKMNSLREKLFWRASWGEFFETDKIDLVNLERATSPVLKHSAVFFRKNDF